MQRMIRALSSLFLALVFTLTGISGTTRAQPVEPPDPLVDQTADSWGGQDNGISAGLSAADLTLGSPGSSFRYVRTLGVTETPYLADNTHLNRPSGLYIDAGGVLYVTEERGNRVVSSNGSVTIGHAGVSYTDEYVFSTPTEIAKDVNGNLWVSDYSRVIQYDISGSEPVFVYNYPETDPWLTGSGNDRFEDVQGFAFDHLSEPHLFVADAGNQRVQVFSFDGEGKLVYVNTIGETDLTGTDDTHFNRPVRLTVDSENRLYVTDGNNNRVQRCESGNGWVSWSCAPFGSGVDLNYPVGIAIDASDQVFIGDSYNFRIVKCTAAGACSVFKADLVGYNPDVAVDTAGYVYASDWTRNVVLRFNSAGIEQPIYMGVLDEPYVTDNSHFNTPHGLAAGADGSLYLTEEFGYRLIKLNAAGEVEWKIGTPGVHGDTNTTFGNYWSGMEGSPALDAGGRVYVTDTSNDRVMIYNSNGSYFNQMGITRESGIDNSHFNCPTGAAISPVNGDIFIVDHCAHRIQVFNNNRVYKTTIGVSGEDGEDAAHFNNPFGVEVAANGTVYVADSENHRVQKCSTNNGTNYTCSTFAGVTGEMNDDFGHLYPLDVAVDAKGWVYVVDNWNTRVLVYEANGAFLTSIGGTWGTLSGELRNPRGISLDKAGNVYIADTGNHRIQVYSPGVMGWKQANIDGFGVRSNLGVWSMAEYNQTVYAGTHNPNGGEVWRKLPSGAWEKTAGAGFGMEGNNGIDSLLEYNGYLYASTYNEAGHGGEIWRSQTGNNLSFQRVVSGGSGSSTPDLENSEFYKLYIHDNQICATTWSDGQTHGAEIWCSASGAADTWTRTVSNGFGNIYNWGILDILEIGGMQYAGTYNNVEGGQIYRSDNGVNWTPVGQPGLGDPAAYYAVSALAEFQGYLYAGFARLGGAGSALWRCQVCNGTDWESVTQAENGFGNPDNRLSPGLVSYRGALYMVTGNRITGMEVWKTTDGNSWSQTASGGFGTSNNLMPYWNNSILATDAGLFVGTNTTGKGSAQVWQLMNSVFLPLTLR